MPGVLWQIRTLGHSCTGNCICTKNEKGYPDVNPECRVAGHAGSVNSIVFSTDGTQIVSGSSDGLVKIWNAESGAEVSNALRLSFAKVCFGSVHVECVGESCDSLFKIWDAVDADGVTGFVGVR